MSLLIIELLKKLTKSTKKPTKRDIEMHVNLIIS